MITEGGEVVFVGKIVEESLKLASKIRYILSAGAGSASSKLISFGSQMVFESLR